MVRIVLVAPEIPANTGNIARTCAATNTPLHLVDPLGFQLNNRQLKRAGLDYWRSVQLHRHVDWQALLDQAPAGRCWCFETSGEHLYTQIAYQPDDWLVFGSETQGLSPELLSRYPTARIPLVGPVRSLNLANAVAVVLFEALRQFSHENLQDRPTPQPAFEVTE